MVLLSLGKMAGWDGAGWIGTALKVHAEVRRTWIHRATTARRRRDVPSKRGGPRTSTPGPVCLPAPGHSTAGEESAGRRRGGWHHQLCRPRGGGVDAARNWSRQRSQKCRGTRHVQPGMQLAIEQKHPVEGKAVKQRHCSSSSFQVLVGAECVHGGVFTV